MKDLKCQQTKIIAIFIAVVKHGQMLELGNSIKMYVLNYLYLLVLKKSTIWNTSVYINIVLLQMAHLYQQCMYRHLNIKLHVHKCFSKQSSYILYKAHQNLNQTGATTLTNLSVWNYFKTNSQESSSISSKIMYQNFINYL